MYRLGLFSVPLHFAFMILMTSPPLFSGIVALDFVRAMLKINASFLLLVRVISWRRKVVYRLEKFSTQLSRSIDDDERLEAESVDNQSLPSDAHMLCIKSLHLLNCRAILP